MRLLLHPRALRRLLGSTAAELVKLGTHALGITVHLLFCFFFFKMSNLCNFSQRFGPTGLLGLPLERAVLPLQTPNCLRGWGKKRSQLFPGACSGETQGLNKHG